MSAAFLKEGEAGRLKDVSPTPGALLFYLRVENNGMVIRDEKDRFNEQFGRGVYETSNGLTCTRDDSKHRYIILN